MSFRDKVVITMGDIIIILTTIKLALELEREPQPRIFSLIRKIRLLRMRKKNLFDSSRMLVMKM